MRGARVEYKESMDRAQKAFSLLSDRKFGVLATMSKKVPGYPFASVTPFSVDDHGRPLFLLSGLALHTKNILDDPKASLLVFEPEAEQDPLGSARMNVMGEIHPVPDAEVEAAREIYSKQHPESAQWMDFGDFRLYQLSIEDVYYIGGFGEMGWVSKADLAGAHSEAAEL
jgi:putative heme iron utilization protein